MQLDSLLNKGTLSFNKPKWMQTNTDNFLYNIFIAGKTGVGKSSFINYLFGESICETGVGKSVTEKGFFAQNYILDGMAMTLYDSWGLEVGKAKEWRDDLNKELERRSSKADIRDWFHTVFYCISAGGSRVEDFELDILKDFKRQKYIVNVVLTKADQATDDEILGIQNLIKEALGKEFNVISVCSEEKIMFDGQCIKPFGKQEAEKAIIDGIWDIILLRLPDICIDELLDVNEKWFRDLKSDVQISGDNFSQEDLVAFVTGKIKIYTNIICNKLIGQVINKKLEETFSYFYKISQNLKFDDINQNFKEIELMLNELDFLKNKTKQAEIPLSLQKITIGLVFKSLFVFNPMFAVSSFLFNSINSKKPKITLVHDNGKQSGMLNREIGNIKNKIDGILLNLKPELEKHFAKIKKGSVPEKSVQTYDNAVERLKPREEEFENSITGLVLYELGFYADAILYLKQHLKIEPDDINARNNLISCLTKLKFYDEAIIELEKRLSEKNDFEDAYIRIADIYSEKENFREALKCYYKALEVNKNNNKIHEKVLAIHLTLGNYYELKRDCDSILMKNKVKIVTQSYFTDPPIENHIPHFYLSEYFLAINSFQDAFKVCSEFLSEYPDHYFMRWQRGRILNLIGKYNDAIEELMEAFYLSKKQNTRDLYTQILYELAQSYFRLRKFKKCLSLLNVTVEEIADTSQFELFTRCYLSLNMIDEFEKMSNIVKEYDRDLYLKIAEIAQEEFGIFLILLT